MNFPQLFFARCWNESLKNLCELISSSYAADYYYFKYHDESLINIHAYIILEQSGKWNTKNTSSWHLVNSSLMVLKGTAATWQWINVKTANWLSFFHHFMSSALTIALLSIFSLLFNKLRFCKRFFFEFSSGLSSIYSNNKLLHWKCSL